MLPKKGMLLHPWSGLTQSPKAYAELIADALRQEHDGTHRTVKTIIRWTGASERSVKNWLSGECGPGGCYLMRLFVKSAAVRTLILDLCVDVEVPLPVLRSTTTRPISLQELRRSGDGFQDSESSLPRATGDATGDMSDGTDHVTQDQDLNERQVWLLERVASGERCGTSDVSLRWSVSRRTAKRDFAALKARGLIHFRGSQRKGRYHSGPV